ncbi:hypothetical protein VPH35_043288 [Triticum aestivum]
MIGVMSKRIVTKFVYPRSCEKWILKSIGRDWRKFKSSLKDAFFKPAIEKNPNIKRKALYKLCPEDVDDDQWRGLVKYWKSKKGRALAKKNIISRSLVKDSHNAGTKSYACWGEDMRQADPEKKRPHRSKVYLATHKKKDDADAKNKDRNKRQLAQNLNGRVAWEGDALQEVLGKEKIGQVHGMGLLPTPKQVYGRTPRYLKNINMTTTDGSPYEVEHDVWEVIAKMKEHIKKQDQIIKDMNNKEGYVNNGIEEENLQSNDNGISRSPVLLGKTKRIQCNGPVEARSSMQHDIPEDNNLSCSHEKVGDHDVNQLQIQQNSSSPQDLVIDSVLEVREMRNITGGSVSRPNQQRTRTEHPHRSKKRRSSSIKAASKVVLKTSTYPNKRNVAYGTIGSTDPRTKAGGIELGAEFALVRIDEPILDNEELVREVSDCKTIGEAFTSGYLIAWPSAFIREKDG